MNGKVNLRWFGLLALVVCIKAQTLFQQKKKNKLGVYKMRCSKCKKDFIEKDIQESHDVPCYLFMGMNRRESKQHADKFKRRWLCIKCHKDYERKLNILLKLQAIKFGENFNG